MPGVTGWVCKRVEFVIRSVNNLKTAIDKILSPSLKMAMAATTVQTDSSVYRNEVN